MENVKQELTNIVWEEELYGLKTLDSWDMFKNILGTAQKNCVPMKRRRVNNKPL